MPRHENVGNGTITQRFCVMGRYSNLKLIIWLMLVVLTCAQNEPDVEYTCDESGMHIQMTFDSPYRGFLYVKGFSRDSNCRLVLQVPTQEASFNIPLMACDMYNPAVIDSSPWMLGILVIQQHPLIPTINDTSEPVACALEGTNVTNWSEVSRENRNILNDNPPNVVSWLELGLAPSIVNKEMAITSNDTNFIYFRVYGTSQYSDMVVTECIAHDEAFLTPNTSIHQVIEFTNCSNTSEGQSSSNLTKSERGLITGVYVKFNPLDILNLNKSFISCSAVLCTNECTCTLSGSTKGYSVIATRKIIQNRYKRSALEETKTSRHYRVGNSLIRSTMKALAERLRSNQRRPRLEKEISDLERRFMPIEDEVIPTEVMVSNNHIPTESPFKEQFPTTQFNSGLVSKVEYHTSDVNISSVNISNTMFISELELEKITMVEYTTESTSKRELIFKDPLSVNHFTTVLPEFETEENFDLLNNSTEVFSNKKNMKDQHENIRNEDFVSTSKVTTEIGGPDLSVIGNTTLTVQNHEKDDCVPKTKFLTVTLVLSFVIVCMILISFGLVLYIRKEKKTHAIDNFLLYNFY